MDAEPARPLVHLTDKCNRQDVADAKAGGRLILIPVRSKVARQASENRARRLALMSPAERVALAQRLGEHGVAAYMTTHGVDRRTAIARIKATHRLGRRNSASAAADED